jgi:RHS repeat-associated protein
MSTTQTVIRAAVLTVLFASGMTRTTVGQEVVRPDYDEYYPSHARGYVSNPYEGTDFGNINLYNGNLTAGIPLGPTLHAGGDAKLQLALHYNSKIWDESRERRNGCTGLDCDRQGMGTLLGTARVGLGWTLEFGHISTAEGGGLVLHTADGGQHKLYEYRFGRYWGPVGPLDCVIEETGDVCYTRDGTDIKVERLLTGGYQASFPDGTVRLYEKELNNALSLRRDFGRDGGTYCTEIRDRWGNYIDITYLTVNYDAVHDQQLIRQLIPEKVEEFRADDTPLRKVLFASERPASTVGALRRPKRISSISFFEPGAATAFLTYGLNYERDDGTGQTFSYPDRLQLMSYSDEYGPSQTNNEFDWDTFTDAERLTDWVYFLDSVTTIGGGLGDDIRHGFRYYTCATDDGERDQYIGCASSNDQDVFSCGSQNQCRGGHLGAMIGVLRHVELPTGAAIEFDYGSWTFNHHHQSQDTPGGNVQFAIHGRWDEDGNIACPGCTGGVPPIDEGALVRSLGVTRRIVFDATEDATSRNVLARKDISQESDYKLLLPVHFDAGYPDVPNPKKGFPDQSAAVDYYTSWSKTTVRNHSIADQTGTVPISTGTDPKPEIEIEARDDESVYLFSVGPTAQENQTDGYYCQSSNTERELFTLPLAGALIYEQHFRGSAGDTLERTTAYSYTVDDHADRISWEEAGPSYGTQQNRRKRAVITYHHGAAAGGNDLVHITRFGYETDRCGSADTPCPYSLGETQQAFASHQVLVESQSAFDSRSFTLPSTPDCGTLGVELFAPLEGATFDTSTQRSYWTEGEQKWLLSRPVNELVSRTGLPAGDVAAQEQSWVYGDKGEVTQQRLHANPGTAQSGDDVVTRYKYVNISSTSGFGQVERRLVGLGSKMPDGVTLNEMFPDVSEYIEYSHETPNRVLLLCQQDGSATPKHGSCDDAGMCADWASTQIGFPAELQSESTIDPGWRLPTSSKDANGNGIALIEYDHIGRVTHIDPTSSEMSDTWLSYTGMKQTEVSVENSSGAQQVVSRYDYDGLGRVTHEAKRQVGKAALSYAEQDFLHRTFRYDGRGTQWRVSNWKDTPDWSTGDSGADIVKTVDPFGRTEKLKLSDGSISEVVYSGVSRTDGRIKDPGGAPLRSRTVTDLDARGNVIRVLEEKDLTTLNDDLENPPPADFVISIHAYDVGDRLTNVSITGLDGNQNQVTQHRAFTYDARGFLTSETYPELGPGSIAFCLHDATGTPGRLAYGATTAQCSAASLPSSTVDTVRDAAGRHLQTWVKQDGSWYLSAETQYGSSACWNSIGRPIRTDQYNMVTATPGDPDAAKGCAEPSAIRVRHRYAYDHSQGLLGNRNTEVAFGADGSSHGSKVFDLGYDYDRWGNVSLIEYPRLDWANFCSPAFHVEASHDPMGLLGVDEKDGATTLANLVTGIIYTPRTGFMTEWQTPSGVAGNVMVHHRVTPDGRRLRVKRIEAYPQGHESVVLFNSGDYAYDGAGNIGSIAGSSVTDGWSYQYDALSRLQSATTGTSNTRQHTYDDFGNMISIGGQSIDVSPVTNRLSAAGTAYDNRGNLIAEPIAANWVRHSRYDLFNRQVAAWSTGSAAPADVYGFAYDQAGERVLRYRVESGAVQEASFFIRDEGGNVLSEFLWSPQGGGDSGEWTRMMDTAYLGRTPIVRMDTTFGGERRYATLVTDHLASVRAEIYDATSSNPSYSSIDYWPFGEFVSYPGTLETHHLFTGHEREFIGSASGVNTLEGLDYMHARYYNHTLGRFMSVDPVRGSVGSSQSWNRYSYVMNSPLVLVDPQGLAPILARTSGGFVFLDDANDNGRIDGDEYPVPKFAPTAPIPPSFSLGLSIPDGADSQEFELRISETEAAKITFSFPHSRLIDQTRVSNDAAISAVGENSIKAMPVLNFLIKKVVFPAVYGLPGGPTKAAKQAVKRMKFIREQHANARRGYAMGYGSQVLEQLNRYPGRANRPSGLVDQLVFGLGYGVGSFTAWSQFGP